MAIHAESNSFPIKSALKDRFYLIPDYQRPYRWSDEEVNQLWEDLVNAYEDRSSDPNYFLGSIVIIKPSIQDEFRFEVIDGQQRLTTLSLLFLVLRERFENNSELISYLWGKKNSFSEERLLRLTTNVYKNQEEWQEMLPSFDSSSGALTQKLKDTSYDTMTAADKKKLEKENLYLLNALLLRDKIHDFEKTHGFQKLQELIVFIEESTELIIITCDSQTSALRIFQTLNNRGMDLSVSDLVKADCLKKLVTNPQERDKFLARWNELINEFEKTPNTSWNFEKLLLSYMQLRRFTEIKKPAQIMGNDIELRKYMLDEELKSDDVDVMQIIQTLTKIQEAYQSIMIEPIDKETDNYIYLLSLLRTEYWLYPLLQIKRKNGYTNSAFKKLVKFLVQLSYRILIRRKPANEFLRPACRRIIQELHKKTHIDEIIRIETRESKEFFINKILKSDFSNIRRSMIKPLVYLHSLSNGNINLCNNDTKWEIEHILPLKWKDGYFWSKTDATEYLNSLGNLILIERSINKQVNNKMYIDKQQIYREKSKLKLVRNLSKLPQWTIAECKEREKQVINEIISLL